jgi:hypothetical protein
MDQQDTRILEVIASWGNLAELASFAEKRHGYGNSDGGFGVTYPGDLDEYQREVEKLFIPEGTVRLYGYWGPPNGYEVMVSEKYYLQLLAQVLKESGFIKEAGDVERFIHDCA